MPAYKIHIGPHKTGSTYLQSSFGTMREFLAEAEVVYPESWCEGAGHVVLARRLRSRDQSLRAEFADLNSSSFKTVIISAEDLSDLPKESIEFLGECIDGRPTTVISYCRRWSEILPSGWQELVKHGDIQTLPEFVVGHTVNIYASRTLNIHRVLQPYAEVFGRDNLRLVSYSEVMDRGKDLLPHFLSTFLRINRPAPHRQVRLNASMEVFETELIRALNMLERADGKPRDSSAFRAYRDAMRANPKLDVQDIYKAMEGARRSIPMNEGTKALLALNQQLSLDYGSILVMPRPANFLFKPQAVEIPYVGGEYLLRKDVMANLRHLREECTRANSSVPA